MPARAICKLFSDIPSFFQVKEGGENAKSKSRVGGVRHCNQTDVYLASAVSPEMPGLLRFGARSQSASLVSGSGGGGRRGIQGPVALGLSCQVGGEWPGWGAPASVYSPLKRDSDELGSEDDREDDRASQSTGTPPLFRAREQRLCPQQPPLPPCSIRAVLVLGLT